MRYRKNRMPGRLVRQFRKKIFFLRFGNPDKLFPGPGSLVITIHLFIRRLTSHETYILHCLDGTAHSVRSDTAFPPAPGL